MSRFDQCDHTCTVDCGHCKGLGPPTRVAPIVTMAVRETGGCGKPLDVYHVCIADDGHAGGCTPCHVEDIEIEHQHVIETLRTALRSARDFIVGHPAVRGEWPMLVEHLDAALSCRVTSRELQARETDHVGPDSSA